MGALGVPGANLAVFRERPLVAMGRMGPDTVQSEVGLSGEAGLGEGEAPGLERRGEEGLRAPRR